MADGNTRKRVFLRKVLFRMDFQFTTEQKQEEIYSYIAEKYGDYFSDRGYEQGNSVDIEISSDAPDNPKFNSRPQTVYYLTHKKTEFDDGRTIKIGKTFLFLDVDLGIESANLPYYTWFADIINFIKESKLFKPMRIGLRKFNTFFLLDENLQNLEKIFEIPFYEKVEELPFELDHFKNVQVYNGSEYSMNFSRNFATGMFSNPENQDAIAHQISFDFDLFSNEATVLANFCEDAKKGLESMNDLIFQFFEKIICPEIRSKIDAGDLLEEYGIIPF